MFHLRKHLVQAEGQPGTSTMHVNANTMFSYAVIRAQAKRLQQEARWAQDEEVQKRKFGDGGGAGREKRGE